MAPDSNHSSPKSTKSDTIKATKEDAATTATREELRNTSISGVIREKRPETPPESENTDAKDDDDDDLKDKVSSPKKKRAHDQVEDDRALESESSGIKESEKDRGTRSEPEKKRHRDEASSPTEQPLAAAEDTEPTDKKVEPGGAKAADATKEKSPAAAESAFAQSGFSKLTQTTSPFGSLAGATQGSVFGKAPPASSSFGSAPAAPAPAPAAPAPTLNFSQSSGASPFGTLGSGTKPNGFGGGFGGGGFASAFGSTAPGKLSSFAKPGETFGASTKSAKPFGAPESDVDEESGDEEAEDTPSEDGENPEKEEVEKEEAKVSDEKKKRLQKVEVNDGEAGEATILQVRAKIYYIDRANKDIGWKERGAGVLKINVPTSCVTFDETGSVRPGSFDASGFEDVDEDSQAFRGARLIMRQDNTHKLLLNTALLPAMKFQEKESLKSNTIIFTAFESAKEGEEALPVSISMKMSPANSKLFLDEVSVIQRELVNA